MATASEPGWVEEYAAVDAEQFAGFIEHEVLDLDDLAEGAEIQRRRFNRMTPPGVSWVQPMVPPVAPFDADYFDDLFLSELLGEDKNSVAVFPLSLALDPQTRETLVYNADGLLIAVVPADPVVREWREDADPARVTLQLDLLPMEDVEPYLYTERRIAEYNEAQTADATKAGGTPPRGLGPNEFGIAGIQRMSNGHMQITVTNGTDAAEVFAYTVWHTSSVSVVVWTNEFDEVLTNSHTAWHPVSPSFDGIESAWEYGISNLTLSGDVGVWEDDNIPSHARVRFYAAAKLGDKDGDGLSDGAEILIHRTDPQRIDTDGDGLLDGYDIAVLKGDPRYTLWADQGIVYSESMGMRLFRGELNAGSSPIIDDTDGDGLPDGWEVQNELDPLDAEGDNGPEGDPDGDGFDNALERELGAPANNAAWNGNELAYRLMHATPVIVTNTRSITTNLIGMRVDIDNSRDCGGTAGTQDKRDPLDIPELLECGYYIDVTIEGAVEDVDIHYDEVSFEAYTNTFYFMGHSNRSTECRMVSDSATRNVLIMGNSTVYLRYDTVSYKWHDNAYCEIIYATNTGPYKVVVSGADVICVGETTQMEASGAAGAPYIWSGNGDISVSANGQVTGLEPGIATVIATDADGCSGEKEIIILKVDLEIDGVSEVDEETTGAFVPVNADNDNGSTLTDLIPATRDFDTSSINAEDDLVQITLGIEPSGLLSGLLRLRKVENGRAMVKVWDSATKSSEITLPAEWAIGSVPMSLYLEGVREGAAKREVDVVLEYIVSGSVLCADTCKVTVTPILTELSAVKTFNPTYLPGYYLVTGAADLSVEVDAQGVSGYSGLWLVQHVNTDNYLSGGVGAIPPSGNAKKLDFNSPYTGSTLVDVMEGELTFPFYSSDDDSSPARFESEDGPAVNLGPLVILTEGQSSSLDTGYSFDIYAAWQNEDTSVYFLGYSSWSMRMQGTFTNQTGTVVFQPGLANATASSSGFTRDNTDRNLSLPVANSELEWLDP